MTFCLQLYVKRTSFFNDMALPISSRVDKFYRCLKVMVLHPMQTEIRLRIDTESVTPKNGILSCTAVETSKHSTLLALNVVYGREKW